METKNSHLQSLRLIQINTKKEIEIVKKGLYSKPLAYLSKEISSAEGVSEMKIKYVRKAQTSSRDDSMASISKQFPNIGTEKVLYYEIIDRDLE